jgi:iron complex outermembrane receptor protein
MDSNASSLRTASPLLLLPVLALGSLASEPVFGQAGARPVIEEITVTARRREESLQNVPVSVSAFTATDLVDRQIRAVEDVARFTPGLSFAKAFGRATDRPVIRGQGNVLAGVQFGVESGVSYFVDGIYYPGDLSSLDLNNMERVEVLRGPQAALFGRNTYSGAINFVTKVPGDELGGDIRLRYGEDDDIELNAVVRGPLVDGLLAGSLAFRYYTYDGEFTNTVTGRTVGDEETVSISGTLDFTPSSDWLIRGRLSYQEDDDGTRPFFLQSSEANNCFPGTRSNASFGVTGSSNLNQYFCGSVRNPRPGTVSLNDGPAVAPYPTGSLVAGLPAGALVFGAPVYNPVNGLAFSGVERDILYLSLLSQWDINSSGYNLITSFAYRDEDRKTGSDSSHGGLNYLSVSGPTTRTPRSEAVCFFCASDIKEAEDYSLEVRIESPASDRLRWMAGAFYLDQDIDTRTISFASPSGGPVTDKESLRNWAVFGQVEYDFTDRLSASIEARYFDEKKKLTEFTWRDFACPAFGPCVSSNNYDNDIGRSLLFDGSVSFSEFAPRATINWQATDEVLLYASWAQGYKPGGLVGSAGLSITPDPKTTYEQEASDTFEIGLKGSWLDNRVLASIAAFYIDMQNIQLTQPLASGPATGNLTSVVTNQAAGEVLGFEIEVQAALTERLSVSLSYALADTRFTKGCDADQWVLTSGGGLLLNSAACTGNNAVNGVGNGSIVGNQFPLSSKNQVSGFADYRRILFAQTELFTNLGLTWEDKKPVQVHNKAFVPSAFLLDARIGLETDRWTVSLYGRNLTDEDSPSMVTRWLQAPLFAGGNTAPVLVALEAPADACAGNLCSVNLPRAFFGDLRRSRNVGIEFAWRFGN